MTELKKLLKALDGCDTLEIITDVGRMDIQESDMEVFIEFLKKMDA